VESATSPIGGGHRHEDPTPQHQQQQLPGAASNFVDEVAALAFDGQVGAILQDSLQAVVLRELLRREGQTVGDDADAPF
jgi:hypothetical protein